MFFNEKMCVCVYHVPFECHYIRGEGAYIRCEGAEKEISQDSLDMIFQLEREVKRVI